MKKLFFLFAVSAMFAACSSDDQTEIVNGGGTTTNPTEQTVSVATVDYENGVQIAIGALDSQDEAQTRATDGAVNFVINLYKVTTKKWNTEECSNRIDLQRFHLSCRFSPTPPQSLQKPNQDVATLLVRNHTI